MALSPDEDLCLVEDFDEDDEISWGRMSLKQLKKRLFLDRQTIGAIGCVSTSQEEDDNTSIKIIETHSSPDIRPTIHVISPSPMKKSLSTPSISPNTLTSSQDAKESDESFLRLEKMVSDLCMSPTREELDSKFEENDFSTNINTCTSDGNMSPNTELTQNFVADTKSAHKERPKTPSHAISHLPPKTPRSAYHTPAKTIIQPENFATPSTSIKTPFKTPGNPVSKKTSLTPAKKQFQHIMSPVASYIKNCPVVPLVKNVYSNRPLPSTSSIPKPIKCTSKPNVVSNKENVTLPSVAYRTAKQTKVIDVPDEGKLPKCNWSKHVMSSIPKAVVIKHDHREITTKKELFQRQDDSMADLSLHQADVSVCIKKSAFKKQK